LRQKNSLLGTIRALIGFLLPSFFLLWTGGESTSMILAGNFFYLWGYYKTDIGFGVSINDSGFHFFNLNWYLKPEYNDIKQGSGLIDTFLNLLATVIYPGNFGNSTLDISGVFFGLSAVIIFLGIIACFLVKANPKISGLLFIVGGIIAIISLLFIWTNATNLTWFGPRVKNNFLPLPLGSLIVLFCGIWNF